jgi:hypothetical protein
MSNPCALRTLALLIPAILAIPSRPCQGQAVAGPAARSLPASAPAEANAPWEPEANGVACRLMVGPRFAVGEPIPLALEIKNVSARELWLLDRSGHRQAGGRTHRQAG